MQRIIPAILAETREAFDTTLASLTGLGKEVHIDFVDGVFIHRKTVLPADLDLSRATHKLQSHLMVKHPELYFDQLIAQKFRTIIFHYEATKSKTAEVAAMLKVHHVRVGLAINPVTDVKEIKRFLNDVNLITIMAVEPGYQGHPLLAYTLSKVEELKAAHFRGTIQLDGGINENNISSVSATGADELVIGSAIAAAPDPAQSYDVLLNKLSKT